MKRLHGFCLFAAFLSLLLSGCSGLHAGEPKFTDGQTAPYTRVRFLDGEYVPLTNFMGRPLAVMFWATHCPHSRSALPEFAALAREFGQRANFIGVSLDPDRDVLESYLAERTGLEGVRYAWSGNAEADEAYYAFGFGQIPSIVVIDTVGRVVGATSSVSEAKSLLKSDVAPSPR